MEKFTLFCAISLISVCAGTDVPALIWSPNRPLSDLPDVFAGHPITSTDFQNKYLKPLTSGDVSALVVFVQDRLSLDDFTHYADVYNPESSGGAFENVKDFMDEQFSVQLPHVKSPLKAIETLRKQYSGKIHQLETPYDVTRLPLSRETNNLVVVHLPETRLDNPEKSIIQSDRVIGKVLSDLAKQGVKYTAVYTAQSPSQEAEGALSYTGRHLLETPNESKQGYNTSLFANETCGMFYALSLQIGYTQDDKPELADLAKFEAKPEVSCGNASEPNLWTMTFQTPNATTITEVKLKFNFTIKPFTQNMDWYVADLVLTYKGKLGDNDTMDVNEFQFNGMDIWAPLGLSYHCSVQNPIRLANSTLGNKTLILRNLQVQPFQVKNYKFGLPWDCVGFFTAGIWMALFSVFILLIILAYGLAMVLNINVMDRFDDSKGKTITINSQE